MTRLKHLIIAAALCLPASSALADGFVIVSGGLAHECYLAARDGHIADRDIRLCTSAIDQDGLESRDRAGTYINRGTLLLKRKAYAEALADFDQAIRFDPDIGEGHVNRGAALLGLHRYAEAVAAVDRGLSLGPSEPEKAYFNRATARELIGDVPGAYADYSKAVELAPNWVPPRDELKRFKVEPK
jgi:tetratricopeptide (TPR) repeat protein